MTSSMTLRRPHHHQRARRCGREETRSRPGCPHFRCVRSQAAPTRGPSPLRPPSCRCDVRCHCEIQKHLTLVVWGVDDSSNEHGTPAGDGTCRLMEAGLEGKPQTQNPEEQIRKSWTAGGKTDVIIAVTAIYVSKAEDSIAIYGSRSEVLDQ